MANRPWSIQVDGGFISLPAVGQNNRVQRVLLPVDSRIKPQQVYRLFVQADSSPELRPSALDLRTCAFAAPEVPRQGGEYRADEVVLLFDSDHLTAVISDLAARGFDLLAQHNLPAMELSLLVVHTDTDQLDNTIEQLRARYPYAEVDRNHYYFTVSEPRLYAHEAINWQRLGDCPEPVATPTRIGIVDGEVDLEHPGLAGQRLQLKPFYRREASMDKQHATAIAVLLAGNGNDPALMGLLSEVELLSAAVLEQFDDGSVATTEAIARALDWLLAQQVRLVNISLSGTRANRVLDRVLDRSVGQGMLIFVAAGNDRLRDKPAYPAAHSGVFAITAIDAALRVYPFANQGEYIDFAAPGVDVWTASSDGDGQYRSGTSFAAPHAVAVAAYFLRRNPNLPRGILHGALQGYSQDLGAAGHDPVFGWGLVRLPAEACSGEG
ncbi:S8 family serine peptidase [Halopseudomonas salegens]|uniref:Subtilase family protein n=1 Tax=Halopseudomonas salegens TaxID=1434072 RepID=A0A1H2FJD7_9GAMM|nr:S8 family serine peptidase [Halopseudomonas salegens]SDU07433.1 Subtilase family protein [Halopseudomonas salegens]